jgi:allophanate hydrolase subunit 2
MVAGAIEVPASGSPIVLGPDHPTTGGYPVLAVVLRADLGRFNARPIGAAVRFTRADLPPPRQV